MGFSLSDSKIGDIFSLHFPIIFKGFFFFCTLSDENSCYFFFKKKSTQSKSIRKTKFGASLFSPLEKEKRRAAGAGSEFPAGTERGEAGVCGKRE